MVMLYEAINDSKTDEATEKISKTKKNEKRIILITTASEFIMLDTEYFLFTLQDSTRAIKNQDTTK